MKVDISNITKVNGATLALDFEEILSSDVQSIDEYIIDKPVSFSGSLTNINGILELDGRLKACYKAKCYRCLKDIETNLDIKVCESIISIKSEDKDPDAYTYGENYLELDKILEDNLILNLPMRHICSKDCKGLCRICGADLNIEQCNCIEDSTNPQMESLKGFFNN